MSRPHATAAALLCACGLAVAAAHPNDAARRSLDESRKLSSQITVELREHLVKEMQTSGPLRALLACKYTCPDIVFGLARKTGWRVNAVSLRPRNPALGSADAWEQRTIIAFTRRAQRGERIEDLEVVELVDEPAGRFFRFARAIPMESMCLVCHGATESIPAAIRAQLARDYPADRATGYSTGEIYGIVSIKHAM